MLPRFEQKFLLNPVQYDLISHEIGMLGRRDPYTKGKNSYPVLSLYYDSPRLDYFDQKINGEYEHIKIRARVYADTFENGEVFFEAKCKYADRQIKYRHKISTCLDQFESTPLSQNFGHDFFERIFLTTKLKPIVWVHYKREPFQIHINGQNIRITFDHQVQSTPFHPATRYQKQGVNLIREGFEASSILMEIKSAHATLPVEIQNMLYHYKARKVFYSKYAFGIDNIHQHAPSLFR